MEFDRQTVRNLLFAEGGDEFARTRLLNVFRWDPFDSWKSTVKDHSVRVDPFVERGIELLPDIVGIVGGRTDPDQSFCAKFAIETCLEYQTDNYLLENPIVAKGTRKRIRKYRNSLVEIRSFLTSRPGQIMSLPVSDLFHIDETAAPLMECLLRSFEFWELER